MAAPETISIVIPAFNEGQAIASVVSDLIEHTADLVEEIIVVDDGSTDNTSEVLKPFSNVRVVRHATNRGYGASLKSGIRAASGSYVLTMDADGQHQVADVIKLCEAVREPSAPECIIGQRTSLVHSPLWRMPGKWLLTHLAQFLTQTNIPDLNSGLRAIRREVLLKYIRLCPRGFSFSTTITMTMISRGYGVKFVPITVRRRLGKSTVTIRSGLQTIMLILRLSTLFDPLRIFLPASLVSLVAGLGWGTPYVLRGEGVTVGAMLAVFTAILLFALGLICDQVAQLRLERYE